jgi:flagellar biosynthesis/type III secretory pathway protein FliH
MTARLLLEVFRHSDDAETPLVTPEAAEEKALAAFETGYSDGWDDASRALGDEDARLRAEISAHLQTLGFGFVEARQHVLAAIGPLLRAMVCRVLPGLAETAVTHVVSRHLQGLAERLADTPVTLMLHPDARRLVEPAIASLPQLPVRIVEDAALGQAQVYILSQAEEELIDVDAAIAALKAAVDEIVPESAKVRRHA